MAQLRDASDEYAKSDTLVLIVAPENAEAFHDMWRDEGFPFIGLPNPAHSVLKTFNKQVNLFKLGHLPTQILVDKKGFVRHVHYGHAPSEMPSNDEILDLIKPHLNSSVS